MTVEDRTPWGEVSLAFLQHQPQESTKCDPALPGANYVARMSDMMESSQVAGSEKEDTVQHNDSRKEPSYTAIEYTEGEGEVKVKFKCKTCEYEN